MDTYYPTFEISAGSKKYVSGFSDAPFKIVVEWNISCCCDLLEMRFSSDATGDFEMDGYIELGIGYHGANTTVMAGNVSKIDTDLHGNTITVFNSLANLASLRLSQAYESQSAGEIVSDLCSSAGLETGNISKGVSFFMYYVDRELTLLDHIHCLARKCGYIVFAGMDGKLNFREPSASNKTHTLTFGENIIRCRDVGLKKIYNGVVVYGESPASSKGDETSGWLTADAGVVKGEAGDTSGNMLLIIDESLRTQEAAASRAAAEFEKVERGLVCGKLKTLGNPDLAPGDQLDVKGIDGIENIPLLITGIRHVFSPMDGFFTTVDFQKVNT